MDRKQFYDEIDEIILKMSKKHQEFYFLMKSSKGIHPIDIKLSLCRLYKKRKISTMVFKKIMRSARDKGKVVLQNDNLLPVPHVLDYDWRFSTEGTEKLFSLINKNCKGANSTIVFVGTPSLFKMYFSKKEMKNRYILIDKNADKHVFYITQCAKNFSYVKCDIMEENQLDIQADLVIMDPPWYLNYNKVFLQFADDLVKVGGRIICVLPPKYTRRQIEEEFKELERFLNGFGIIRERYIKNAVSYNTPPFERNVLRENGIYCLPKGWRTGDVLIAKKMENRKADCSPVVIPKNDWDEISIGIVRYKLRTNHDLTVKSFDLLIENIYENDIYPSVKRSRTIGEKKINIWTSGNRVFYCKNIQLFYYILMVYSIRYKHYDIDICDKIESDFNIRLTEKQKKDILKCIDFIEEITIKELKEYGKWRSLA